jgi:hypothetical protein
MRTFGDLLQFHQKKVQLKNQPAPSQNNESTEQPNDGANGSASDEK